MSPVARALGAWYRRGHRDLPWRRTADPYRVWVSEIMLQQTRAQTAIPYYERFLARFPTVEALAAAPGQDVLALWAGLGYYSRARNLRAAAQRVVEAGGFPRTLDGLRALPGIGGYTAAAIASIAFGLPHAVLDGNVLRVASRVANDPSDIASPAARERFRALAQSWLDPRRPAEFNQALMELGATVCLPRNPQCPLCPLRDLCAARAAGTAGQLPVKLRAARPVAIETEVLVVERRGRVLLRQRDGEGRRLAGFWELPAPADLPEAAAGEPLGSVRHTITRHRFTVSVRRAELPRGWTSRPPFRWLAPAAFDAIPISTVARKSLKLALVGEL
ncbi:MAG: A/G-specific adenine glycosylase [Gemmataceae bacterium]|nr:A/G-specific adenine glycosylase [Gemmataceae bacterium]